ncbi:type 1 glutamine amidotransferase [Candidatus Bathyarchaeota archaeon]|nr:MAG: type 1 glutamine amidotransferase [Candidatus Bathyarchaeota archaeon]
MVADEFEDLELFHPLYRLQEEGISTVVIGLTKEPVKGKKGYSITPNASIDEVNSGNFDFLVVPGGKSPEKLRLNNEILRFVKDFDRQGKPIAAICHAGQVLASAGIVKNRTLTCVAGIRDDMINAGAHYVDQPVVVDGNLVTSRVPSDLPEFARAMIEVFRKPRLVQAPRSR